MLNSAFENMKADWETLPPGGKAFAITLGLVTTALNPIYPLVYGSTYVAYSMLKPNSEETNDDDN